jgi:protoporphyrinogen IX oxidase
MLWIKAFHIIFVVSWFAGLFYLPRLYVNHAMTDDPAILDRFVVMERKLFAIMTLAAVLASVFGFWLMFAYNMWVLSSGSIWLHLKLVGVLLLVAYHIWCYTLMQDLAAGRDQHSHVWFRVFNEIPTVLLILVVVLTVLKPI